MDRPGAAAMMRRAVGAVVAPVPAHAVAAALAICALATAVNAGGSTRSMGLGGASIAVPDPALVGRDNPAVLGIVSGRGYRMGIFEVAVEAGNNAYSLADYSKYNGAVLTEEDEREMLGRLGGGPLEMAGSAFGSGPAFGFGPVAVTAAVVGDAGGALPDEVLDLVLNGNPVDETVVFDDAAGRAWAAADFGLAYGMRIDELASSVVTGGTTTVGIRARYLLGLSYADVPFADGRISTTRDTLAGSGRIDFRTATGGSGYALDFGLLHHREDWNLGLRCVGLLGRMRWSGDPELRRYTVEAGFGDVLESGEFQDPETADTTMAIGSFDVRVPMHVGVGAALERGTWLFAADLEHAALGRPIGEAPWRLSLGAEVALLGDHVRPRLGGMLGGAAGPSATAGLSLVFGPFRFDLDGGTFATLNPSSARGLRFAMGSALVLG
jgi:hypothetical protein